MSVESLLVAKKLSVLEYDSKRDGLSIEEAVMHYQNMGADGLKILESHKRQQENFESVVKALADRQIRFEVVIGDEITPEQVSKHDAVVALGGDNYLQHVSHFVTDQLMVGVNSDPQTSAGALTYFDSQTLIDFLPKLISGEFNVEEWTRLETSLNGERLPMLSVSEVYIGAFKSTDMSRYLLEVKSDGGLTDIEDEQKSSGLIIATGAGSTGWYDAAARYSAPKEGRRWGKYSPFAWFVAREPFAPDVNSVNHAFNGMVKSSDNLSATWLAHGKGLVSIDSRDEYILTRGEKVSVRISDKPLKVVLPT